MRRLIRNYSGTNGDFWKALKIAIEPKVQCKPHDLRELKVVPEYFTSYIPKVVADKHLKIEKEEAKLHARQEEEVFLVSNHAIREDPKGCLQSRLKKDPICMPMVRRPILWKISQYALQRSPMLSIKCFTGFFLARIRCKGMNASMMYKLQRSRWMPSSSRAK
ncbi:hypothetical protein DI09_9p200 [Mitosporidium daphniae]|uniref:Uncharacterized protein n=1 Tax=Mitosporidium daphniae TaxID=1485682 RepID=A0A098VLH0_9MICR|nr:uncharacterized protein DI09_9p200 [Mitosporidium daphniae]KGG49937.1 hypothetical protein DI09_9p200 [Mitosporidium daphniae]|eukprot:XP_013236364.1 uncharacterized protein DI09_9p200 [Mitosporidium daphniae]